MPSPSTSGPLPSAATWRASLRRPIPALDGVRGLAILAVLAHQLLLDGRANDRLLNLLWVAPEAGWAGVQLFFVLSGFLITGILIDTRDARRRWSSFFVRRGLRIFPPYYLLLALLFVVLPALARLPPDVVSENRHQGWYWLYLANWSLLGHARINLLGHCWSLSVEEQFYLLWPFVVFLVRERTLIRVCVVVIVTALVARTWMVFAGMDPEWAYELTVSRMDALALGALLSILVRRHQFWTMALPRLRRWTWLVGAMLLGIGLAAGGYARTNRVTLTLGQTVLAVGSALLVLVAVRDHTRGGGRAGASLSWRPLRLFGKHSYAIYLFHHPLHLALQRIFLAALVARMTRAQYLATQLTYFVAGSAVLLGLAMVFHVVFERPILSLKRFFTAG
jgi:peptidoglycan/LPS O-acetylase OafA/YrhL